MGEPNRVKTNQARHTTGRDRLACKLILIITSVIAAWPSSAAVMYFTGGPSNVYQVNNDLSVNSFAALPFQSPNTTASPHGIAMDGSGNLYVANYNLDTISKITSSGVVSTYASLPTGSEPWGIAFDAQGNLFVADNGTHQISKVSPGGTVSLLASFTSPTVDLTFDKSGNMYVTRGGSTALVDKITPSGTVSLYCTLPAGSFPRGMAFDSSGNLYVVGQISEQITKTTPGGTVSLFATLPTGSAPHGLVMDSNGYLYTADRGTNDISKISPDGLTVSTFISGVNAPSGIILVPEPSGVCFLSLAAMAFGRRERRRSAI